MSARSPAENPCLFHEDNEAPGERARVRFSDASDALYRIPKRRTTSCCAARTATADIPGKVDEPWQALLLGGRWVKSEEWRSQVCVQDEAASPESTSGAGCMSRHFLHESNARGAPRSAAALPAHASKIFISRLRLTPRQPSADPCSAEECSPRPTR